jgi:sec-independent protein translocase protein TatA
MENILLFNFFGPEMLVVLFAILLLFGGKKIPELMRGIGKGIREFNAARSTLESELKDGMREADRRKLEEKEQENNA